MMGYGANRKELLRILILMTLVLLVILGVAYWRGLLLKSHGVLMDPDGYMRLVRVEQLAQTDNWYDPIIHRSNYPYGDDLHWTRLFDIILLLGAYSFSPLLGFKQGLLTWGIIVSPLLGLCSLFALDWATRPILDDNARPYLWLLFVSQTLVLQVFYFGRPDHHGLLLLLFILLLGCLLRIPVARDPVKWVLLAGILAALALWTSVETTIFIFMVVVTLWLLWICRGEPFGQHLYIFCLALFTIASVFLLAERPFSSLWVVEYDKISVVYIFIFMLMTTSAYLLAFSPSSGSKSKLFRTILVVAAAGAGIWLVFPDFFRGPMAEVNPAIVPIWLSKVVEAQPIWRWDHQTQTMVIGSVLLGIVGLSHLVLHRKGYRLVDIAPLGIAFLLFIPAAIYQLRMTYYLLTVVIVLLAYLMDSIINRISSFTVRDSWKTLGRVAVIFVLALGPPGLGLIGPEVSAQPGKVPVQIAQSPDFAALCGCLSGYMASNKQVSTILTAIDFGPEILYRTDLNVIAGPYHRNAAGILYVYEVMAQSDLDEVRQKLDERSIDLILLCPDSAEGNFYLQTEDRTTFYERLASGERPEFLEEVHLPRDLAESFILLRVKR